MYRIIGGVLGLGGAMLMAYFHYFATMTNSALTSLVCSTVFCRLDHPACFSLKDSHSLNWSPYGLVRDLTTHSSRRRFASRLSSIARVQ